MKKKEILKEQKKLKEQKREVETLFKSDKDVYNVFKIALGVILFIGLVFVGMNVINGNWNLFNKDNKKATEIDSRMVIAGTMFNKEDKEYLVLAYNMKDEKDTIYYAASSNYQGDKKLYYLDLSSGFNEKFIGDKAVISNDLNKLKFSGATLLVIKGDKITKSYTKEADIIKFFSQK